MTWVRRAPGWYTSELGEIGSEGACRWWFWPSRGVYRVGPYRTLAEAKRAAEGREE